MLDIFYAGLNLAQHRKWKLTKPLSSKLLLALQTDTLQIPGIKEDTTEILNAFTQMKFDKEAKDLRSWLSATDPSSNLNRAREQRQTGTGLWFLHGDDFAHWKNDKESYVWLYGIPGCGKTVLRCVCFLRQIRSLRCT